MTCKRTDFGDGLTSWSCSRERKPDTAPCSACKAKPSSLACGFELRGPKAGQTCGKALCRGCAQDVGGRPMCPAHARIAAQPTPETVNRDADELGAKLRAEYDRIMAAKTQP